MPLRPRPLNACEHSARRSVRMGAGLLAALILAAYHNSFSGAFVFDDVSSILENTTIRRLWPLTAALSPPEMAGIGGRPLANFTFALSYALSGRAPWGFHAGNVAIHILAALALMGVLRRTFATPPLREQFGTAALPLAFAGAALWAVHPLQTAVVDYVSQRTEGLMALGYLLTLYAFIRGTGSSAVECDEMGSPRHQIGWFVVAFIACVLGLASKEVMATAPVIVLLYDRTFIAGSWRKAWQLRWRVHLALASTWILLGWLVAGSSLGERGVGFGLGVSSVDYTITACRAVVKYLRLTCWPFPLVFDYGWAFATSGAVSVLFAIGCLVLVGALVWALYRRPVVGFCGCWLLVILAPTSSVIPIIQQPIAESRMYLPLAALSALAVAAAFVLWRRKCTAVGLAVLAAFVVVTVNRNRDYRSALDLWSDTVAKMPANPRAHNSLAAALLAAGQPARAIEHARTALALLPAYPDARTNLAAALLQLGETHEAIAHFETALRASPQSADAHYNLADALLRSGRDADALALLETALRLNPQHARAHNNLSVLMLASARVADAIAHGEAAVRLAPELAPARYNLGNALAHAGRLGEAIAQFNAAVALQPDFAKAHHNLGVALLKSGRIAEAIAEFETALRIQPDYAEARRNLEIVRQNQAP